MPKPRPTIGRIVHYVSHGTPVRPDESQAFPAACRTGIVTEVDPRDPDRVGLAVLNPAGTFFHPLAAGGCEHQEPADGQLPAGGSWHWPEPA